MHRSPDAPLLEAGLSEGPQRPAFVSSAGCTSYGDLACMVRTAAGALERDGFGSGHRLAVVSTPTPETFAIILGALERGMIVSALSGALGEEARRFRNQEFRPHRLVASMADLERRQAAADLMDRWSCSPGLVMWTSGTTGSPRGAYLSLEAIRWNMSSNATALGLQSEDRTLLVLDPAYCYGLIHQVLTHLAVGASVVIPPRPGWIPDLGAQIEAHACSTLAVVPSILQTLVPVVGHLERLRVVTVGGAPVPESLLAAAHRRMPRTQIYVTYGLTEAGPRVCTRRWTPDAARPGNVGHPFPGIEISVADDGELLLDTPSRSTGRVVEGRLEPSQGRLRTGDLVAIEPDGSVRIYGRRSRAINRGGQKISPEELERVLCSDARVRAARVVGVPDRRFGEAPLAYVQPVALDDLPDPVQLAGLCRRQIGNAWVPKRIEVVATLPTVSRSWKEIRL